MSAATPSATTLRKRRNRDSRERGYRFMDGWVPPETIDAMIESGWTNREEVDNREAFGAVVIDMLDCWARGTLTPPK